MREEMEIQTKPNDEFVTYLKDLVAKSDHISMDAVTPSYILNQRTKHVYPSKRFNIPSSKGGYDVNGKLVFTLDEWEKLSTIAKKILDQF